MFVCTLTKQIKYILMTIKLILNASFFVLFYLRAMRRDQSCAEAPRAVRRDVRCAEALRSMRRDRKTCVEELRGGTACDAQGRTNSNGRTSLNRTHAIQDNHTTQ